ncbi:hypothetical protein MRB53_018261 [Persea americana]|uniref:Uncharacterized protein n=1 Tax=Persea americana TaxID=3435 RepID=A0ACC2M8T7_PERAE|nr:hypothetical protein MRB53_018261 [Persea americana]
MHQRCSDGRKPSFQLVSYFAGPTIQDIERNLPPAYHHRLPPHLASLPVSPDPFTLPSDRSRFVDLNTGRVSYKRDISFAAAAAEAMGENGSSSPQLDSQPTRTTVPPLINLHLPDSPTESMSASSLSPTSTQISCLSSEVEEIASTKVFRPSSSPPEVTSMVLKGCRCCLIYILIKEEQEPKCPKCKNTDLVDFLDEKTKNNNNDRNKKMKKE